MVKNFNFDKTTSFLEPSLLLSIGSSNLVCKENSPNKSLAMSALLNYNKHKFSADFICLFVLFRNR
jgi:hypothetical protein